MVRSSDSRNRLYRRLPAMVAALAAAALLVSPALASTPGQRLSDYLYAHAAAGDRAAVIGVVLQGGHVAVVNGAPTARGVLAVIRTTLPDTRQGSFPAQRLCAVASVAAKRLELGMIGGVEVHARDGATLANSFRLGLPVCHRSA